MEKSIGTLFGEYEVKTKGFGTDSCTINVHDKKSKELLYHLVAKPGTSFKMEIKDFLTLMKILNNFTVKDMRSL